MVKKSALFSLALVLLFVLAIGTTALAVDVPTITSYSPEHLYYYENKFTPVIEASFTGSDITSVTLTIGGVDVTSECTVTTTGIFYNGSRVFDEGEYTVVLTVANSAGTATETWKIGFATPENYNQYFGEVHAHTIESDGQGTITQAYTYARDVAKLDFFAVTDHLVLASGSCFADYNDFYNTNIAPTENFNRSGEFVALWGWEMTYTSGSGFYGHFNVINTEWVNLDITTPLYDLYDQLAADPQGIGQFNHPSYAWGTFLDYGGYSAARDEQISLIEVRSLQQVYEYERALKRGWHISPAFNEDTHDATWGTAYTYATCVLAPSLTRSNIVEAIHKNRVFVTGDLSMTLDMKVNGKMMGETLVNPDVLNFDISVSTVDESYIGLVEIMTEDGVTVASTYCDGKEFDWQVEIAPEYEYYFLFIQGKYFTVTSPVWVEKTKSLDVVDYTISSSTNTDKPYRVTVEVENNTGEDINDLVAKFYLGDLKGINLEAMSPCEVSPVMSVKKGDKRTFYVDVDTLEDARYITVIVSGGEYRDVFRVAATPLQITEVNNYSPQVQGATEKYTPYEYVEIYNNTNKAIDLSNVEIDLRIGMDRKQENWYTLSGTIQPYSTVVIWLKSSADNTLTIADFNNKFGTNLNSSNLIILNTIYTAEDGTVKKIKLNDSYSMRVELAINDVIVSCANVNWGEEVTTQRVNGKSTHFGYLVTDRPLEEDIGVLANTPGVITASQVYERETAASKNTQTEYAPNLYVDVDFINGEAVDALNNALLVQNGGTIGATTLTHNGVSYTVPAYTIVSTSDFLTVWIDSLRDSTTYNNFIENGFTAEIFFEYTGSETITHNGAIMGNCNGSGWAMYLNQSSNTQNAGGIRFIASTLGATTGYAAVHGSKNSVFDGLVHILTTVKYDETNDETVIKIYENGVLVGTATRDGKYNRHHSPTSTAYGYNFFAVGANVVNFIQGTGSVNTGSGIGNSIVVDAKLYGGAATDAQVASYYNKAVAALSGSAIPTYLTSVVSPVDVELSAYYATSAKLISSGELPSFVVVSVNDKSIDKLPIVWQLSGTYSNVKGQSNVYTWSVAESAYAGIDLNGLTLSGSISVKNTKNQPTLFVDVDFSGNGSVTDVKNNSVLSLVGNTARIETASVTLGGTMYNVPALVLPQSNTSVLKIAMNGITNASTYKSVMGEGYVWELFIQYNKETAVNVPVMSATLTQGIWINAGTVFNPAGTTNSYRFIVQGTAGRYANTSLDVATGTLVDINASAHVSALSGELVHLVTVSYPCEENDTQYAKMYINGVRAGVSYTEGAGNNLAAGQENVVAVGGRLNTSGTVNHAVSDTYIIDAKIYKGVMGEDELCALYAQSVAENLTGNEATAPVVNEVTASGVPTKTLYSVNESINLNGLTFTARYSDGTTAVLPTSALQVSGFDTSAAGYKTVTVSYGGKSVKYAIKVGSPTDTNDVFMDADFTADGVVRDVTGNATLTLTTTGKASIKNANVVINGRTYNMPAYVMQGGTSTTATDYILGTFTNLTQAENAAMMNNGFSVEIFYKYTGTGDNPYNSAVFGQCNASGWALYTNSTPSGSTYVNGTRMIVSTKTDTGTAGYVNAMGTKGGAAGENLSHVIATYSYNATTDVSTVKIYENGELVRTATKAGSYYTRSGLWQYFAIGANATSTTPNSASTNVIIVDAKMYGNVLTESQASNAYAQSVYELTKADGLFDPKAYVDVEFNADGSVSATGRGGVTTQLVGTGASIGAVNVTVGNTTYNTPALILSSSNAGVLKLTMTDIANAADYEEVFGNGFTWEVLVQYNGSTVSNVSIMSATTTQGIWMNNETTPYTTKGTQNSYRLIAHGRNAYYANTSAGNLGSGDNICVQEVLNASNAKSALSKKLMHLVAISYPDNVNDRQYVELYIDGALVGRAYTKFAGNTLSAGMENVIALGGRLLANGTVNVPVKNAYIVDANVYTGRATASDAVMLYQKALAEF